MDFANLLEFHIEINKLKQTKRFSTCKELVRDSTSDHSWGLALLALDCIDKLKLTDVDPIYSVKIALVHDLSEYEMDSDVDSLDVARGNVSKQEKAEKEIESIKKLTTKFNRNDIYEIWKDFEEGRTIEARYVKALDKIETLKHVLERGHTGEEEDERDHEAFYANKAVLAFPELIPLLKEVKIKFKERYERQGFEWKPEYDKV